MTQPTPPRRKKRVRPPRKIIPRGKMGVQWIVGSLVLAGLIALAGLAFVLSQLG